MVDGTIVAAGSDAAREAPGDAQRLHAEGLVALPGLVDLHTHLREPGREDAETIDTGSQAAAAGGFTAVFAMANTDPVTDTAEAAERVLDLGRRAGYVDVVPVGAVSKALAGEQLAELGLMARSRARVRVFSDDGRCVHDSRLMRRALEYVRAFDGVISQHAQDPHLADSTACCHEGEVSGRLGLPGWPGVAEESIVARDVMLARHTGSRVHIAHVSTAGSVEVVRWAKAQGIDVTAEVTPHHLMLTTDLLTSYDSVYKVNPPLRPREDVEALRAGLADGTIDVVATDHAPHVRQDKEHAFVDAAFGMLGLETALSVVSTVMVQQGSMGWADVARVMSTAPARIARLEGHGQGLQPGAPANLTLVDPDRAVTVDAQRSLSMSRNNPWHGRELTGAVHLTMLRGQVTAREGLVWGADADACRVGPVMSTHARAVLVLEDGRTFSGEAYGAIGETVGEAVFSTGMTGYQETLTDPSYHRQVVVMTAPHIGNTGVNTTDMESQRIWVAGFVVRDPAIRPSNWRSQGDLAAALVEQGVVGISGIDTRALTRHLRDKGAMRAGIFSGSVAQEAPETLVQRVLDSPQMAGSALAAEVSTKEAYVVAPDGPARFRVAALDLGIKGMTPRQMADRGVEVHVLPATTTYEELAALRPDGVFFSNGPGDPATADREIALLREVLDHRLPFFGICFGNQLLGRALGLGTFKLPFGHRGINQPVLDRSTGKVEVTSHNHGFAVAWPGPTDEPADTPYGRVRVSHVALNDDVVEGLQCLDVPAFSVQYHPEAAAGPHDAEYLFDRFVDLLAAHTSEEGSDATS